MKTRLITTLLLLLYALSSIAVSDPKYPFHPSQDLSFSSSNLPIVIINLDERMADKEADKRVNADMKIIWDKSGGRNYISDADNYDYDGKIGIKYRGNSSYYNSDKKPFGIRTQNASGKKQKASILGMGEDEDWALLAPFNDKSLIRDVLLFDLMRGTFDYVPTGRYCEVVLNGVYQGIYIMTARVRQGPHRINIEAPSADEGDGLTGGYHLEIDRPDDPGFWSNVNVKDWWEKDKNQRNFYQYKFPDEEDLSTAQKNYIHTHVRNMEYAISGDNFKDTETGYRAYIDTLSLMDFIIAQEFTKNVDAYRLSTPIYKYPDSYDKRFKFSIWDFNLTMGNADYKDGWSTQGWSYNNNRFWDDFSIPWMFKRILQDEIFYSNLKERWTDYRKDRISDDAITQKIDSLTNLLQESQSRNFTVWNKFNNYVWPNYYISSTWNDELNYMKDWVLGRADWIDQQWAGNHSINLVPNGSFDASTQRGIWNETWLSEWVVNGNSYLTENSYEGKFGLSVTKNSFVYQVVTELLPGKYTVRFHANTQLDPKAYFYIKYHTDKNGNDEIKYDIEGNRDYHLVEIKDIEITNNFSEIGFVSGDAPSSTRLRIDNVEFIRQEPVNSIESVNLYNNDWILSADKNNMSLKVILNNVTNNGQLMEIYTITGSKIYSGKIQSSESIINGIFTPNNVYLVRLGEKTKKVIF